MNKENDCEKVETKALSQDAVMPCTFSDLEIGDKVQIKHYHLYKDGYWQLPSFIDYKYLGIKNGEHHFQNVNYEHEHFRMKKDLEDNHVFLGKYKAEFFKVYVVKDDLVRIWERDCVELTDRYVFLRALRCTGNEYNWRICLSMVSDKYFRSLDDAKQYIKEQRELKVKGLKSQIEGLKKAIEYQTEMIDKFIIESDWDYDDRGIDYTRR